MLTNREAVWPQRLVLAATLLALLCLTPASAAEAYKVPGTKSGFVTMPDGVKIHYLEAGRGPAILFIPGWTMPAWIWERQIAQFAKTHRVVAMDPRSQGESSQATEGHYPEARARDIKAVVDQLKLAPVVLVGWSMGVNEVVSYIDQFGTDTVAGLVLVDGSVGWDQDPAMTEEINSWMAGFYQDRRAATEKFVRQMYKKPQSEDYYQRVTRAALRTPTNTALALLVGNMTTDNRPALAKINKPTFIIAAPSPWLWIQEDMQKRIAGSRFVLFENAAHALFVDEPERFNARLAEFLQQIRQ